MIGNAIAARHLLFVRELMCVHPQYTDSVVRIYLSWQRSSNPDNCRVMHHWSSAGLLQDQRLIRFTDILQNPVRRTRGVSHQSFREAAIG